MAETPLVSIVIPTFNAGRYLRESVESVLLQDYPNIECLVVDGGSTDDTQGILRTYGRRLRTIFIPPLGPASAIQTGLSQARGSILAWLSADDRYEAAAVRTAVSIFLKEASADIVYGDALWIDECGVAIGPYPTRPFDSGALSRACFISQPAAFFRASAYRECPLDVSLPVSFDYDLWIKMAARQRRFEYVPKCLACSRMHRACLTFVRRREVFEVTMDLLNRHYGYTPVSWVFGYLSYLRDGRDQFFEPLRNSIGVFAATLLWGLASNRTQPLRFARDWASTAARGLRQHVPPLSGSGKTPERSRQLNPIT